MVAVVELSFRSWLVAGLVPRLSRQPLKKLGADAQALLTLLRRWQAEATKAGGTINRIVAAFEAGRDGFWLARWLRARGIEAYVIHPTSIPVSREHRRAKTDRLDTGLLLRAVLGWLRGEPKHCSMAAIPTITEEDARRPNREHQTLHYKDYRADGQARHKVMTLATNEFIRRFLISHVLPKGFHRIRYYGLLTKSFCAENLARARTARRIKTASPD